MPLAAIDHAEVVEVLPLAELAGQNDCRVSTAPPASRADSRPQGITVLMEELPEPTVVEPEVGAAG